MHLPDKDYPLGDGRRIVNFLSARVFTKLTKPLSIRLCSSSDKVTVQVQVISCWILLPVEFDRAHWDRHFKEMIFYDLSNGFNDSLISKPPLIGHPMIPNDWIPINREECISLNASWTVVKPDQSFSHFAHFFIITKHSKWITSSGFPIWRIGRF